MRKTSRENSAFQWAMNRMGHTLDFWAGMNESTLQKWFLKLLYQIGGCLITEYKERRWKLCRYDGERSQNTHTRQEPEALRASLREFEWESYVGSWALSLKGRSRQWNLALCLPCFLSWCQIYYPQQRQDSKGGPLLPRRAAQFSTSGPEAGTPSGERTPLRKPVFHT